MAKKALIFSAPSGSGKSTIVHSLLKAYPELEFSISATTRKPRGNEKDGSDYYFLSVDEFKQKIEENSFVEYEEVYTNRMYGTLKTELDRIWDKGHTVIFDVDVVGGCNLKDYFGDHALSIFIKAPSLEELKNRLNSRGTDDTSEIEKRLSKAEWEMQFEKKFDEVIVNDELPVALNEAKQVVGNFLEG